jgi:tetratricopeptide (TPR) repeat protein
MNNEGALLLQKGECKRAILRFDRGQQVCHQLISDFDDHDGPHSPIYHASLDACMDITGRHTAPSAHVDTDIGNQFVYLSPITIPPHFLKTCDLLQLLPLILIFNQALAHQLDAQNDPNALRKAAKLYAYGLRAVVLENLGSSSTHYILACLNNMGIIYRRLHRFESATNCFKRLLSTLMFLVETKHGCSRRLNIFIPTVSHLIFEASPPAAAA